MNEEIYKKALELLYETRLNKLITGRTLVLTLNETIDTAKDVVKLVEEYNCDVLYEALYNGMTEESSYETISVHKTKQGARDAVAKLVKEEHENFQKRYGYDVCEMSYRFGLFQAWDVNEIKVQD